MLFGGSVLGFFGIRLWVFLGGYYGLIPGFFGMLGVLMFTIGVLLLVRRNQLAVVIDQAGVDFPAFTLFQRESRRMLRCEEIARISKHESIKGRLIEFTTTDGGKTRFQARHYCELDAFLAHCRSQGLPVA
jgi:hypothetical protein